VKEPPVYNAVRNNFMWADHAARTLVTGGVIGWLGPDSICDPSCGDASILEAAYRARPFGLAILADVSQPQIDALAPNFPHTKQVGDLYDGLASIETVDLVVLTEILEHLPDPDSALRLARDHARMLIASSPIGDPECGGNHEHLWAWDEEGYQDMLESAGWHVTLRSTVVLPGINGNSQIWVATQ
jgi:hypothetical protein